MEKVKKNDVIKVKVTGVQKYGAFVNSEDNNYDGLIHISEISYGYVKNVNDYLKIGDSIYAEVVEVSDKDNQLKLSIKDIDYKKDGTKLKRMAETKNGFTPLKDNLEIWINKKIKEIMIEEKELSSDDIEMLQDMIVVAINDAMNKIDKETENKMGKYTQGMPGLF